MKTTSHRKESITAKLLAAGLVVTMAAAFFPSCRNDMETIRALDLTDTTPGMTARDVEIYYSEKAKVKIKLLSPLLLRQEEDNEPLLIFPEGFTIHFYDSAMNLQSTITADYGVSNEKKKLMEARHNVVVENFEKGERLNTEELFWDRDKAVIYTDKFVRITSGEQVINGEGLTSREPFRQIDILRPKGPIEVREDE